MKNALSLKKSAPSIQLGKERKGKRKKKKKRATPSPFWGGVPAKGKRILLVPVPRRKGKRGRKAMW